MMLRFWSICFTSCISVCLGTPLISGLELGRVILQLQGVQGGAVVWVTCFVFSLFLTLGLEGLGWGYSQEFPFFDQVIPLCLYPADIQRGKFEWGCGIWPRVGAGAEFR